MPLDFTLDDEHQLVKQSVRAMLDRYIPRRSEIHEAAKREGRFPQELWDAFAAIGLMGCLIPEEYGGNA